MTTIKIGGVLLTGFAAYLIVNKALNTIDNTTKRACEASKWKNYYKCWSNGSADDKPVAPGYSVTTTSNGTTTENSPYEKKTDNAGKNTDTAEAIVNACKEAIKKRTVHEAVKDFDTKQYQFPDDAPPIDIDHGFDKDTNIRDIKDLIFNMTINGATQDELVRAIKHSMVLIDAERYHLDWVKSYIDNGIGELVEKYKPEVNDMETEYEIVTEVDENGKPYGKDETDNETVD